MATSWRIITVNMNPSDDERLIRLADLWGLSKAATVRRLIVEATRGFEEDYRNGHTCPPGVQDVHGTSNPDIKGGPCPVCWPTAPTRLEREDGMKTEAFQRSLGPSTRRTPWWVHVARRRELHAQEAADAVDEAQEALDRIVDEEPTWMAENDKSAPTKRRCTARTKSGARCRIVGRQVKNHVCGTHKFNQEHKAAVEAWKRQAQK